MLSELKALLTHIFLIVLENGTNSIHKSRHNLPLAYSKRNLLNSAKQTFRLQSC